MVARNVAHDLDGGRIRDLRAYDGDGRTGVKEEREGSLTVYEYRNVRRSKVPEPIRSRKRNGHSPGRQYHASRAVEIGLMNRLRNDRRQRAYRRTRNGDRGNRSQSAENH